MFELKDLLRLAAVALQASALKLLLKWEAMIARVRNAWLE